MTQDEVIALTPEEVRVKVAEKCGWEWWTSSRIKIMGSGTNIEPTGERFLSKLEFAGPIASYCSQEEIESLTVSPHYLEQVPDYCSDLNAMHEVEKELPEQKRDRYRAKLQLICSDSFWENKTHWAESAIHATAEQRARAFLMI